MKSKFTLFLFILFTLANTIHSQNVEWVEHGKAPKNERGDAIVRDNDGNIYITGDFQDSIRFDTEVLYDSYGTYCAKYDTSGNIIWAKKNMGGDGLVFDGSSYLYLYKNDDENIQKVDLNGNLIYDNSVFSTSVFGSNGIQDIYVQGSNLFITGYFSGDGYFDSDTIINQGNWDVFIAKTDFSLVDSWVKGFGSDGLDKGYGVYANTSGDVFAVGYFRDTVDFGGTQKISNGNADVFIVKYNSNGSLGWVNSYGATGLDLSAKILADASGDLYVNGRYVDSLQFGAETIFSQSTDAFVAKISPSGTPMWITNISGTGNDEEADMDIINNELVVISTTAGNVTVDGNTTPGLGSLDMHVLKADLVGNVAWTKIMGGASDDEGSGICFYNNGIYFTGSFKSTANFDSFPLTSEGMWDVVTGKITNSGSTGIEESVGQSILVYPNPSTGIYYLMSDENISRIDVMNLWGGTIVSKNVNAQNVMIDLTGLPAGVYFYRAYNVNKISGTGKLILE